MDSAAEDRNRAIVLAHEPSFRLGAVEVRPATRELVGPRGREVLEPRVMQVLVALARAGGGFLTRDDLTRSCWDGRVVGEDAITRVVSRLRRATEGVGRDGWTLETVTKVGYRLVPADHDPAAAVTAPSPRAAAPSRRLALAAAAGAGVAALGGGALWWRARTPAIPPKARELYVRGSEALRPGLPETNSQAQGFLREAVVEAPDWAEAWGALARAYTGALAYTPPQQQAGVFAQAEAAARRALELDPDDPQGLAALALLAPTYRNWAKAEALYNRALAGGAAPPGIEFVYARLLAEVGRMKDCVVRAQAAVAGDEFATWNHYMLGIGLWSAGRVEEADRAVGKALARWPRHYVFWFLQQNILAFSGRADRAVAMGEDRANWPINIPTPDVEIHLLTARALASGSRADTDAAAAAYLAAARRGVGYAENAVLSLPALGRLDDAFAVARALYFGEGFPMQEQRFASGRFDIAKRRRTHMLFMPPTRSLRADPRFPRLVADLGIADYWKTTGKGPDDPAWARPA